MTLRMEAVVPQLAGVIDAYREQLARQEAGLAAARQALVRWAGDPEAGDAAIRAAMADDQRPYALSAGEPLATARPAPPFTPVTVIAADGSSIDPDRFAPVPCFVVNIGSVVLPYGVPGDVQMDSRPLLGPNAGASASDGPRPAGPSWGVTLQRDARELTVGAHLAFERSSLGPAVLLFDGTLLPWDLDSPRVAPEVRLDAEQMTKDALALIQQCGGALSVGAYISGTQAADVVTSLGALAPPGDPGSWPSADAPLFARILADGERSALFRSSSQRMVRVEERLHQEVCFFYVRIGHDLARVELPRWATSPAQVDRLHATLIDQCERAGGYPRALQEAHEQAVISTGDRAQFERVLENAAARSGFRASPAGKHMSKRRRAV